MARWELVLDVDASPELPLFLRIARQMTEDIRRGRLRPGDPVPGSRELAATLGCHRNTVLAALRELQAEGWLEPRARQGTYVSRSLPEPKPRPFTSAGNTRQGMPDRPAFDVAVPEVLAGFPSHPRGALQLGGGIPDVGLLPTDLLARAYRRALKRRGRAVLDYGDPLGQADLRAALAAMLASVRGLACTAENVIVTRGSQMAVDLLARALVLPGDLVAVEELGYRPAWSALRRAGATLVPVPVDGQGLRVDALAALAAKRPLRALYLTPHHQYPTTVTLAAGRRLELLALAQRLRLAVLEDDYDHEFHYDGRPVLPLASADLAGSVVYIGTLSKLLAPGLRLGFAVAPTSLVRRLGEERMLVDRQGDHALEQAVAELLEDGHVQRHARRARRAYLSRRDALAEALTKRLGSVVRFKVPAGGIALWLEVDPAVDPDLWAARAGELGVGVHPGRRFAFDGKARPFLRMGYGAAKESVLVEAVKTLERALPAARRRQTG